MSKFNKIGVFHNSQVNPLMAGADPLDENQDGDTPLRHPPTTVEEFLEAENITEWPQRLTSEGILDFSELSMDSFTKEHIDAELADGAPLAFENFETIEIAMNDYEKRLKAFASFMANVGEENISSRLKEGLFHAPSKEYLEKAASAVAIKLHPSHKVVRKDMKETLQEEAQALKTRDVSYVSFVGFRSKELSELPSQLEAPQLLNKVTESQLFNKGFLPLWKKLFLSEASSAILQDAFWWIFLEMFESNPEAQDRIFTRLAGSYIALFASVHQDIRDKFFTEYPRCLSQAVYLTFFEAFPESHNRFGEEFISEMSSHIYQWISGIKPPVGHWKSWPVEKFFPQQDAGGRRSKSPFEQRRMSLVGVSSELPTSDSTLRKALNSTFLEPPCCDGIVEDPKTKVSGMKFAANIIGLRQEGHPRYNVLKCARKVWRFMKFDIDEFVTDSTTAPSNDQPALQIIFKIDDTTTASVKDSVCSDRTRETTVKSPSKPSIPKILPVEDSAPAGPGPEMERVLFNLSGRSPLVAHYLYVKNLRPKETVGKLMKRTEVLREPPPGVTFSDVIRKSKITVKRLHDERKRNEEETETYIKKLHHQHRRTIRKLKEAEKSILDPAHLKVKSDKVLDEAHEKVYLRRVTKEAATAPDTNAADSNTPPTN